LILLDARMKLFFVLFFDESIVHTESVEKCHAKLIPYIFDFEVVLLPTQSWIHQDEKIDFVLNKASS